jgi:hypothetical protein
MVHVPNGNPRISRHPDFAPGAHPSLSDMKGCNTGSFTSVLLHASSSSLPSDSGESSQGGALGSLRGTHGTDRSSFERSRGHAPPPQLRGSCRKCVECTRPSEHRVVDEAKGLWPGQLASPFAYFTIFRRLPRSRGIQGFGCNQIRASRAWPTPGRGSEAETPLPVDGAWGWPLVAF